VPNLADRVRRLLPSGPTGLTGLTGLAGIACAACCAIPLLLGAGALSGAGWAAAACSLLSVPIDESPSAHNADCVDVSTSGLLGIRNSG
jgi:hypothetical protein